MAQGQTHHGTEQASNARTEILIGAVMAVVGLIMRVSDLDIPMVNVARTGEVIACVGVLCVGYGIYLRLRR